MWHTTEIIKVFMQMADDYGYEVFADRKKCVGLCGDLLSIYTNEKNIMQMLFHAGFGEALIGVPFGSEEELKMGLLRVDKFLQNQAIEKEVRLNVIEIVQEAFTLKGVNIDDTPVKPTIIKNYNDLHFKITIPEATEFADRMQFKFKFIGKPFTEKIDTILESCVVKDKVNNVYGSHLGYALFPNGKSCNATISVAGCGKKFFMSDAIVKLSFLCSNNKKVVVVYSSNLSHKLSFKHIEISQMTDAEFQKAQDINNLLLKTLDEGKKEYLENNVAFSSETNQQIPHYTSPDILEFSDALKKEILFLKQGKGKKYKIVNGTKINKDRGIYTYTFELETELHLPDDAPVVVDSSNGFHAVGTVLLCEDFQIMLLLDRDLNDRVNSAYLMVEPWKLLEALDKKMNSLNPNINHLAIELMENGPKVSTTKDISNVPKGQSEVIKKLNSDDILTVWGPPGTGKTFTMAKIAMDYIKKGKSVLIVSHSNVSVDGVIKRIVHMQDSNMDSYLAEGKILRFGYVRDDVLSNHPYATSFNYALSNCPDLSKELDIISCRKEELKAKRQIKTAEYDVAEKKIKKIRDEIRKEERKYVEKAQLIGTTISRATIDPMFVERQFDLVMFDEVSMAYVPQVIVAAALAKEKFVCVGDFRQLAPIAQGNDAKKILQIDVFSYLKIVDGIGNMYWHPWLVMLAEQRRMHPDISEFPNKYVYRNLLQNHISMAYIHDDIIKMEPLSGEALNLIDLAGTYCAASKNNDNSRYNILSAIVSFATAVKAEKNAINSVGIITPYAAQTRLIRAMIRDYYDYGPTKVSCATVHQFQGSESDVLIFDAVESYPGNKVGFLMGKVPSEVVRLINVAITRARGKLITVANYKFWDNSFKGTNHIFYKLLCHIKDNNHGVISHSEKTLKPYIESINPNKMINVFVDEMQAMELFEKDMQNAFGKVIVSIPDGELKETAFKVLDIIEEADNKGIDILMKSNDYQSLPEGWKKYCWGTENAIYPLILIDDSVAWYGLPCSKLKFVVDKKTSMITVVPVIVRMKGKNTIEMMKSLSDLEMVEVGLNKKQIVPKKGATHHVGGGKAGAPTLNGLASFIQEKEYCPKCKNSMILTKNYKGTSYIKCSNNSCDHTEFLTPDLMNWYISSNNITCPKKDGGELKGILGKFGPCVRCDCGHFLKPEEI